MVMVVMMLVVHGAILRGQDGNMERPALGRKSYADAALRLRWRAVSRFGNSTVSRPIAGSQAQTE
jgi:hypothetical protein